jgi:hypothetical protein
MSFVYARFLLVVSGMWQELLAVSGLPFTLKDHVATRLEMALILLSTYCATA